MSRSRKPIGYKTKPKWMKLEGRNKEYLVQKVKTKTGWHTYVLDNRPLGGIEHKGRMPPKKLFLRHLLGEPTTADTPKEVTDFLERRRELVEEWESSEEEAMKASQEREKRIQSCLEEAERRNALDIQAYVACRRKNSVKPLLEMNQRTEAIKERLHALDMRYLPREEESTTT